MEIGSFATFNIAVLVLALGKFLNAKIRLLREFNIPEPVSSGLLVCVLIAIWHAVTGTEIRFDLTVRDFLLLYFFAGIGLNSDLKTLVAGGRPLITLVVCTARPWSRQISEPWADMHAGVFPTSVPLLRGVWGGWVLPSIPPPEQWNNISRAPNERGC